MTGALESMCGVVAMIFAVVAIVLTYHKHMQAVWKDIAKEEADEMFDNYVRHCEYRVHTELHTMIVDETK